MKILFIGGTGTISSACVRLAVAQGMNVTILNRGNRDLSVLGLPPVRTITADIKDEQAAANALKDETFDVVAQFINFRVPDIERDIRLFSGKTGQYIFISSASVYQKPLGYPFITEATPLANPFWQYSRDKIACEHACMEAYRSTGFPITIVRPSYTYQHSIPAALGGGNDFTLIDRIRRGRPVIIHGDGSSLWQMTHADDFAKGFVGLLGNQQAIGEAFHITSDEVLTWNQIYEAIFQAAGAHTDIVHIPSDFIAAIVPWMRGNLHGDKAASAILDNSKIKRVVPDYRPNIPFVRGIKRTVAWFEEKAERMTINEGTNDTLNTILEAYQSALDAMKAAEDRRD